MPEFLIERIMPGVARLDVGDLRETSRLSYKMLLEQFPSIEWLQSYATDDVLYCIYRAPDEGILRDYARGSTLPVHRISEVRAKLDPTTLGETERPES
jgi:hypothetical protein